MGLCERVNTCELTKRLLPAWEARTLSDSVLSVLHAKYCCLHFLISDGCIIIIDYLVSLPVIYFLTQGDNTGCFIYEKAELSPWAALLIGKLCFCFFK